MPAKWLSSALAVFSSWATTLRVASASAGTIEAVAIDPPDHGPGGSELSPITTFTLDDVDAGQLRRHLRDHRVGAGADVLGGAGDAHGCRRH